MNHLLIKGNQVEEVDHGFIKVRKLLSEDDINNLSVSIVNIDGKEVEVEKGDLVFIKKGSAYFDRGKLIMLAINNPRYDQSAIKYLD